MLTHSKVLERFTVILSTTDEDGVCTSRRTKSKLIEGQGFATSIENALFCGTGEPKSSDSEFGQLHQTLIVCHGRHSHDDLALASCACLNLLYNSGKGDGGTVDFGEVKTAKDDLYVANIF